jgi:ribosomal-protein-alanine N-acetyltransferase
MAKSVFRFLSRQSSPVELKDSNHLLRLPDVSDYAQWYRLRSDSRAFLQPWEPTWAADELTRDAFRQRVVRNAQEHASGVAIPMLLFDRSPDQTLLGGLTIGYIRRGASQACMIGYWMGQQHAGKGHMKAAVNMAVDYIFQGLQLHRIEAACIADNTRSMALLEQAGFRQEGMLRSYLKINGAWRDHIILSRLAEDVNPSRETDLT